MATTTITPIITQMELDRDRLKKLVNGTDTDTVVLENRTERSIANMVQYRLDTLTVSLNDAITRSETAATNAETSENNVAAAETRINTVETNVSTMETDVTNLYNQTDGLATDVSNTKAAIDTIKTDIDTTKSNIDTTYSNIQTIETNVNSTYSQTNDLYTNQVQPAVLNAMNYSMDARNSADDAQAAASTVQNMINLPSVEMGKAIQMYPRGGTVMGNSLFFVASVPMPFNGRALWYEREFEIAEVDNSVSPATYTTVDSNTTQSSFSYSFGEMITTSVVSDGSGGTSTVTNDTSGPYTHDGTVTYAWRVRDKYIIEEDAQAVVTTLEWSPWEEFTIDSTNGFDVSTPTVTLANATDTSLSFEVTSDAFDSTDTSETHAVSQWAIILADTNALVEFHESNSDTESWTIPINTLRPDESYKIAVRYIGDQGHESNWSTFELFATQDSYYIEPPRVHTDLADTTIDVSQGEFFSYTLDTSNVTIEFTNLPGANAGKEFYLYLEGDGSLVSWSGSNTIQWYQGSAPTSIGNTWNLFKFVWMGDKLIGKLDSYENV